MDTVIAAMEANHPHLTTQKSFYVEISRARHREELVTDDRKALGEHLEAATGERVAALEALRPAAESVIGGSGKESPEMVPLEVPEVSRAKTLETDLGL